ncbi:MAG: hypothetical protein ACOX2K_09595 [Bacillota bacterium]|jgi:hypothetical protein
MNIGIKDKLAPHVPPGVDVSQELRWLCYGGIAAWLYSCGFLVRYASRYDSLFHWDGTARVLDTRAIMPDFVEILGGSLNGFLILALCAVAMIAYHYAYHYQGSKSIYLMKRLPSRWELPRRCLTLPLLAVLACLCAALLLLLIYYGIYMALTPRACLAPDQWQKIWSVLVGVTR